MQAFDVVINGGGMVGLTLACGLQGSGLRVAVVEQRMPEAIPPAESPALRVSAINAASQRLLRHVRVWDDIVAVRATPYRGMEVWDNDSFGKIAFDGGPLGFEQLGHIIENPVIHQALWRRAAGLSDVELFCPASLRQVAWGENEAFITLDDDRMLTARLVVGADGADSWLRRYADIPLTFWDYQHHALVATVRTERPHGGIARQAFHGDGILAFLPLAQPDVCSIVWSLPPELAEQRRQMPAEQFTAQLARHFNLALGLCTLESERLTFPLTGRYARDFAAHRLVLVGDAAHTVHPLAGQGVNLGLMDVAELLSELQRLQIAGKDIGHYAYLRRYERRRKHSAAVMLAGMQALRELFDGNNPLKKWVRDAGLRLADTLPGIKPRLIRQAMGLTELPAWLDEDVRSTEKI
ncbi:FAD-dependent 2-octaprenylphenol hydroxylase [Sodalis ligni]|uniref:2-octaprenyl-3-methyl-6-methoxy-1,4-benzoquinol hydroxylase n=1 Tax=Sodalis ligni TaxID=2697027 RepID=A0A4R1NBB2_9GAMM|nr:FAD-dependent 2-octaprenylphenol hydroxylase [Sodalis ligni]TCL04583.1 2-octaprenyl-3-methyl-6-methoxy-1,4-benzoquinol hydroxylase [Sodalis ligni]